MDCLVGFFAQIAAFAKANGEAITAIATLLLTFVTAGLVVMARRQIVTSRAQLRAYVAVESGQIFALANQRLRALVIVKNYGQTPAYKFRMIAGLGMAPSFAELPPPGSVPPQSILGVLAPSGVFQWVWSPPHVVNAQTFTEILEERLRLFVYGDVHYEDAFGNPRTMKFRTMLGGATIAPNIYQLASCPEGNDAD
jgi:hypothetical protein